MRWQSARGATRSSWLRKTTVTFRQPLCSEADQKGLRLPRCRDHRFVCPTTPCCAFGLLFVFVGFSGAKPSVRRQQRQVIAERSTRVGRLVIGREYGFTFGTVVEPFPLVAWAQAIHVRSGERRRLWVARYGGEFSLIPDPCGVYHSVQTRFPRSNAFGSVGHVSLKIPLKFSPGVGRVRLEVDRKVGTQDQQVNDLVAGGRAYRLRPQARRDGGQPGSDKQSDRKSVV